MLVFNKKIPRVELKKIKKRQRKWNSPFLLVNLSKIAK